MGTIGQRMKANSFLSSGKKNTPPAPWAELYEKICFDHVPPRDLADEHRGILEDFFKELMVFANTLAPKEIKVAAYNPTVETHGFAWKRTILQFVMQDYANIVDSAIAALNAMDVMVHLSVHPMLKVQRNAKHDIAAISEMTSDLPGATSEAHTIMEIDRIDDPAKLEQVVARIQQVLEDVQRVAQDKPQILKNLDDAIQELKSGTIYPNAQSVDEAVEFLEWLKQDHYIFLGYREHSNTRIDADGSFSADVLHEKDLGLYHKKLISEEDAMQSKGFTPEISEFIMRPIIVRVIKGSVISTVHKHAPLDRIVVRFFDDKGKIKHSRIFLGIFSSRANGRFPEDVPILRHKADRVIKRTRFPLGGHNYRSIQQIIYTYPRDELFQIEEDELYQQAIGILAIQERRRSAVFVRRDMYERFVSCLVYTPRDNYNSKLRFEIQNFLVKEFGGVFENYSSSTDSSPLARLQIIIRHDDKPLARPNLKRLQEKLEKICQTWGDQLEAAIRARDSFAQPQVIAQRYANAFSLAFQESHTPESTVEDIVSIEKLLSVKVPVVLAFTAQEGKNGEPEYHLCFYHEGESISPLRLLRIVENFGLTPTSDSHYSCDVQMGDEMREVHVHDFPIQATAEQWSKLDPRQDVFEEALQAIWQNLAGNDRLNELLFLAEMTLPEVVLLRAIGRYLMQARLPYSQEYYAEMLVRHAPVMRSMVDYFHAKFDPANHSDEKAKMLLAQCENYIAQVKSLDEDRVLRRVLNVMQATVRTNYYQRDSMGVQKPQLSMKIKGAEIIDLPKPVPMFETFVYAHRVEGIHLRSSKISRGGIRWSDRREDFRDEILDLMKAQTVKNSVIVPTGAKGGFYVKYPPLGADRKAIQAEAIACYQIFIRGLLDITDNWVSKKLVRPKNVVIYDDEDPYLVVAADKGTATFSDIANTISKEYSHWLGDAFASGGSAGYDHKVMGITARGAWESVRHHGFHLGINVDKDPITVIGVGDMGGDVFGNGLLLSPHLKLIGVFSYSHIFCDPSPDPAASFAERERLFKAVANWDQYDTKLLSPGGRIYSRSDKELELTPEIRAAFDIEAEKVTPAELMRAILRARADLMWFGGIGTYVKSSQEMDVDVRDKANDILRINADELRCKIVGEGANLGMTQRARIEAARHHVALNTDFIDNSAGVNSSDYEVNIKILLNAIVAENQLDLKKRNELLESMQDEVAELVLYNNQAQNTALGVAEEMSPGRVEHFGRLIQELEDLSGISRKLEALPLEADLDRMNAEGAGLTRPEISVIMSHTKLLITHTLAQDSLMDDPAVQPLLNRYFPTEIVKRYPDAVRNYALRHQLLAMLISNALVNQASVYMPKWLSDRTGLGYADIARSFIIAGALFDFQKHWENVRQLQTVSGRVQRELLIELMQHTDRTLPWILNQNELLKDIGGTIKTYQPHFAKISENLLSILPDQRRHARNNHEMRLVAEGVPADIAAMHANIRSLAAAPSVIAVALDVKAPMVEAARLYFQVGERFGFDNLREQARQAMRNDYWQRQAISALIEDFSAHQLRLTRAILQKQQSLTQWCDEEHHLVERLDALMRQLQSEAVGSVTQLTVANRRLRGLVPAHAAVSG